MSSRFFASFMCIMLAGAALVAATGTVRADPHTPEPQASGGAIIVIRAGGFYPQSVTIAPGATVTFRNDDHVSPAHTVASTTGAFGPQSLGYGMTFRVTLTKPGKYPFNAADASYMKGEIIVTGAGSESPAPGSPSPGSSPY